MMKRYSLEYVRWAWRLQPMPHTTAVLPFNLCFNAPDEKFAQALADELTEVCNRHVNEWAKPKIRTWKAESQDGVEMTHAIAVLCAEQNNASSDTDSYSIFGSICKCVNKPAAVPLLGIFWKEIE